MTDGIEGLDLRSTRLTSTAGGSVPVVRRRSVLLRVGAFLCGYVLLLLAASVAKGLVPQAFGDLTWGLLASASLVLLTRVTRRAELRESTSSQPPVRAVADFLAGSLLGFLVYTLTLAMIAGTVAPLRFSPTAAPTVPTMLLVVSGFIALACMEELGFRGYPLQALSSVARPTVALLVSSLLFAASHVLFGWPWQRIILGVLPSGILFGTAALVSGGLAMPIGLHASVNVAQWIVGEKPVPGYFAVAVDSGYAPSASMWPGAIGAVIPLLAAAALWRWYPRPAPTLPRTALWDPARHT